MFKEKWLIIICWLKIIWLCLQKFYLWVFSHVVLKCHFMQHCGHVRHSEDFQSALCKASCRDTLFQYLFFFSWPEPPLCMGSGFAALQGLNWCRHKVQLREHWSLSEFPTFQVSSFPGLPFILGQSSIPLIYAFADLSVWLQFFPNQINTRNNKPCSR